MNTDIDASDVAKALNDQSKDDTSTIRFKPVKLNPEDIDSIHDIDVFELIKDLIVNSGIAKERKE